VCVECATKKKVIILSCTNLFVRQQKQFHFGNKCRVTTKGHGLVFFLSCSLVVDTLEIEDYVAFSLCSSSAILSYKSKILGKRLRELGL
jgi:hypothetical protein